MNYDYLHPRDEIALTISRIYRNKMTTMSGGNLSILDENGDMWITPAGIDKGRLTPADIVCVRHDGSVEGHHKPSSEYPFHRAIYDVRPDLTAIVHAHPPQAAAARRGAQSRASRRHSAGRTRGAQDAGAHPESGAGGGDPSAGSL